jgi:tetratricopeptide (TPR) repeat protein
MRVNVRGARGARLISAVLALLSFGMVAASAQNAPTKLTAAQWQADVDFLAEAMPRQHPNLFRRMSHREDFAAAVKQFRDQIPSLSEDEIIVGLMKIVAMVKDGHTGVFPHSYFRTGVFTVRFYLYRDGLFVKKAAPAYAEAVGGRVIKIGNYSAEEVLKLMSPLVAGDNEMGAKENAPILLSIPELLAGTKINEDKHNLNLVVEVGGKEKTIQVKPSLSALALLQPPSDWVDAAGAAKTETPLYLKDPKNNYWFEYLKEQKLVYVQQNAVQNKPDESIGAFYKRVFDFVAANPVEKFVLDLRNNDGGNNGLNRQVVIDIIKSKIDERGKLFVITGRATFSAAQNFVNELEKYTKAIFVGEPTAAHPNHYGDATPITLPNSKLDVRVSTIYWQDVDPRDTRRWTAPEIAADFTSRDYVGGKDPALQAVLDYTPGSSFIEMVGAAATQKEIGEFVGKYKSFKSDPKNRFVETEALMNRLGYTLLQSQRVADAVEIFKLNAEAYPNSANVYDSLGDALAAAGRKEEAIKSYEKALAIDPTYSSSLASLRKLKGLS